MCQLLYYQTVAHTVPAAALFAKSIGLQIPEANSAYRSPEIRHLHFKKPIRRMVITGTDTLANTTLLFGVPIDMQSGIGREARLEFLLDPPQGSIMHTRNKELDEGLPEGIVGTPHAATEVEKALIRLIREVQESWRSYMTDDEKRGEAEWDFSSGVRLELCHLAWESMDWEIMGWMASDRKELFELVS